MAEKNISTPLNVSFAAEVGDQGDPAAYVMAINYYGIITLFSSGILIDSIALWRMNHQIRFKSLNLSAMFILKAMLAADISNFLMTGFLSWFINSLEMPTNMSNTSVFKNVLCKCFNMFTHLCFFLNQWTVTVMAIERCSYSFSRRLNHIYFSSMRIKIGYFLCFCISFAMFFNYLFIFGLIPIKEGLTCNVLAEFVPIYYNYVSYAEVLLEFIIPQLTTVVSLAFTFLTLCHQRRMRQGIFSQQRLHEEMELNSSLKPSTSNHHQKSSFELKSRLLQIGFFYVSSTLCFVDLSLDSVKSASFILNIMFNLELIRSPILEPLLLLLHMLKFFIKGIIVNIFLILLN